MHPFWCRLGLERCSWMRFFYVVGWGESKRGDLDACRRQFPRESLLNALNGGALLGDLAHLDDDTVIQHRAALCDFNRFVETASIHEEIAANCFFGLGEWSVGDDSAFGAGDDARLF